MGNTLTAYGEVPNLCYAVVKRFGNSTASFQLDNLALCLNVNTSETAEVSAGRKPPKWNHPCAVCSKPVRSNEKRILCDGCCNWYHTKCIGVDNRMYMMLSCSDDLWYCTN